MDYDLKHNELLLEELGRSTITYEEAINIIKTRRVCLPLSLSNNYILVNIIKILHDKFHDKKDLGYFLIMLKDEKLIDSKLNFLEATPSMTLWEAVLAYCYSDFFEFLKLKYNNN